MVMYVFWRRRCVRFEQVIPPVPIQMASYTPHRSRVVKSNPAPTWARQVLCKNVLLITELYISVRN